MFNATLLADLRGKQRYSQRTLAEAAGVKASFVASLESGTSQNPGHVDLAKVSRVLGVDPSVFFDELAESFQQVATPKAG